MNIKKHIPNILTLLNLFCGCMALVSLSRGGFEEALFFVSLGIFFDFFDGFFARKFGVSGPLGVQLDSLADMVTSGVVPGFLMYIMIGMTKFHDFAFLGFVITLGACYRLANFNIDERQTDHFIGLPTPANTLFFMSLPLIFLNAEANFIRAIDMSYIQFVLIFLSAYIMNAEIPLFSLKIKNFSVQKYKLQLGFLMLSIILIITLKVIAIPLIIVSYVLLSVVNNILAKK
ncbi:CDP-alcohol phosphatidyltransferase family protein [Flavobacterium sp. SUN046]|uniref:CDP-alcohol phosphatidyltransferase family protein n=1 Tax=Flavobacterium sp. SUN046 TaxID=3002440 RepID=UPI002DBF9599|nr:CDP-alcohol phosphatidyltransferase family protein [Flavobacterium sp. SUN046]MEC4050824.1 CDP-alcohol phosphatidyltransferase family protein [Flavobacterium sp. SUN046]